MYGNLDTFKANFRSDLSNLSDEQVKGIFLEITKEYAKRIEGHDAFASCHITADVKLGRGEAVVTNTTYNLQWEEF